jgi:hypothetical protein
MIVHACGAPAFEKGFDESGSVLLLCWHHLQELFSYRREDVVAQRVAYLQSLPMVAAVASFRKDGIIGTVIDLQSFEVAAAFNNSEADVMTVRDEAAKSMFRLTSGADLVRPFLQQWTELRQACKWGASSRWQRPFS